MRELSRRTFLKGLGLGGLALALQPWRFVEQLAPPPAPLPPVVVPPVDLVTNPLVETDTAGWRRLWTTWTATGSNATTISVGNAMSYFMPAGTFTADKSYTFSLWVKTTGDQSWLVDGVRVVEGPDDGGRIGVADWPSPAPRIPRTPARWPDQLDLHPRRRVHPPIVAGGRGGVRAGGQRAARNLGRSFVH